jgi:hypothetical protein
VVDGCDCGHVLHGGDHGDLWRRRCHGRHDSTRTAGVTHLEDHLLALGGAADAVDIARSLQDGMKPVKSIGIRQFPEFPSDDSDKSQLRQTPAEW